MIKKDRILKLATDFRKAIEKTEFTMPPMDHFPIGSCGYSTIFVVEFLKEHGYKAVYCCGEMTRGETCNTYSHAWALVDASLIIDITGDQYKNIPECLNYNIPVYVGEMDAFHRLFSENIHIEKGYIDAYDEDSRYILRILYNRIKQNLGY